MRRLIVVATLIVVAVVIIAAAAAGRGVRVTQPIAFNHKVHIDSAGLACVDCHQGAAQEDYAGLPSKDVCIGCHDIEDEEEVAKHEVLAALAKYHEAGEEVPWQRLEVVPEHVFFPHFRHVTEAGLDCTECHRNMGDFERPPQRQRLVMSMTLCVRCHEDRGAGADCILCHR